MSASIFETQQEAEEAQGTASLHEHLFVVLEAERPLARGARFSLRDIDEIVIGRGTHRGASRNGRTLEVHVPSPWMSARNACLTRARDGWHVRDTASRNGTFVNGVRVDEAHLEPADLVEAGHAFFTVRSGLAERAYDEDAERTHEPFGLRTLLLDHREQLTTLMRVAERSASPILLLGPTGSGKEVLARAVHEHSGRRGAFVGVNCGALPSSLVEGLLFGHVRGAFSGAMREEIGFVRAAHQGTLFLDEIGDLPTGSQAALLRVLQEREVIPVGTTHPVRVDFRVIAATHRPIDTLTESGGFRSDLLARLRGFTHRLAPLAARREDLGVVTADVLEQVAGERASMLRLSADAARALVTHAWPLNARELHQSIVTAVALVQNGIIDAKHLPPSLTEPHAHRSDVPEDRRSETPRLGRPLTPRDLRVRADLEAQLTEQRGNVAAVAREMQKAPAQIHRWMKRFGLDPNRFRI